MASTVQTNRDDSSRRDMLTSAPRAYVAPRSMALGRKSVLIQCATRLASCAERVQSNADLVARRVAVWGEAYRPLANGMHDPCATQTRRGRRHVRRAERNDT